MSQSNLLTSDCSYPAAASHNYWAPLAEPADTEPVPPDIPEPNPTQIHNANHIQAKKVSWKDEIKQQGGQFHYYSTWRFKELKAAKKRAKAAAATKARALADATNLQANRREKNHKRVD